jgi:hypothetical protein
MIFSGGKAGSEIISRFTTTPHNYQPNFAHFNREGVIVKRKIGNYRTFLRFFRKFLENKQLATKAPSHKGSFW